MNTFTFNVNKKTNNNNSSNNFRNDSSYIDNIVLSRLKKAVPYAFTSGTTDENYIGEIYIPKSPKKKTTVIDITIKNPKKSRTTDKYSDFIKAVKYLAGHSDVCDTYDFMMDDGTPIKIFADEIQIGYTLIPLNKFTLDLYNSISKKTKKNIIDIFINISK